MSPQDLGAGFVAYPVWRQHADREHGIPVGVVLRHASCRLYVAWTDDGALYSDGVRHPVTLLSLVPLSIEEAVVCGRCGRLGFVREGRWQDAGDVAEREVAES